MIRKSTWVILAIFVILLAAAWGLQRFQAQQQAEITPTPATVKLLEIQENTLASLRVENNQGKVLVLGRNAEGLWTVIEPVSEREIDTAQAESAITQLLSLRSQFTLEMPDNLSKYGLQQPAYTITLSLNGGERHVVLVGAEAPAVSGYYIQLDGGAPRVVSKFSLDPVLKMIENPPYKATETPTPSPSPETSETPEAEQTDAEIPEFTPTPEY